MKYRKLKGYKYQLLEPVSISIDIRPIEHIVMPFSVLTNFGLLTVKVGYCWDGASGPTWDTEDTMFPSLIHDVLYQMMREALIPLKFKDYADSLFSKLLLESGMSRFRAWYYYLGVKHFGNYALKPKE